MNTVEQLFKNPESQYAFCHATHSTAEDGTDVISVKYKEIMKDGTVVPRFTILENYERPYWVTREQFRNYKDKKTYEPFSRLKMGKSTQTRLKYMLARELGYRNPRSAQLGQLLSSPYVYGLAPTVTSLVKHKISEAYPLALVKNEVASTDIETDMIYGDRNSPIMQGISYKGKINLAVMNRFMKNVDNPKQAIIDAINQYIVPMDITLPIEDKVTKKNIVIHLKDWCNDINIDLVDTPAQVSITSLKRLHELKVDIATFWNINFDIPNIIKSIEDEGYDPKTYFNDPCIKPEQRHFKWWEDKGEKTTASNKTTFKPPSELWSYLETHAGFIFLDPMSYYRKNRAHLKQEISYSLDYLAKKRVNMGKLRFDKADHLIEGGEQWHIFMQTHYPAEYCAYCIVDCILVELFDYVTKDLSETIGPSSDKTTYQRMFKLPNLLEHSYFFEMLEEGFVLGQAGMGGMIHDLDKYVIGSDGIIISLQSHLIGDNGVFLFKDMPYIQSQIRIAAADNDIRSAYPYGEMMFNLEHETIERELTYIEGKNVRGIKELGFLIAGGIINSVAICQKAFNYPSLMELQFEFEKDMIK